MSSLKFPSDEVVAAAVKSLHDAPEAVVINTTGGFAGLTSLLWNVAGASRTLLDTNGPYVRSATIATLGGEPQKYCVREVAHSLADRAFESAVELIRKDRELFAAPPRPLGLGGTAAHATDRVKKGADRFHVAVRDERLYWSFSGEFKPGVSRVDQGKVADLAALMLLMHAARLEPLKLGVLWEALASDILTDIVDVSAGVVERKFASLLARPLILPDGLRGRAADLDPARNVLLCGAFNPVHDGHHNMAAAVRAQTRFTPVYALAVDHPDKGRLDIGEVERRIAQFAWNATVLVTEGDGLFIEKARRFPGFGFVVGADTVQRLLDPKYYGGVPARDAMLAEFAALGTRFLVVDRQMGNVFVRLADLRIPESYRRLFTHIEGRWDMSSTEIRARQAR